MSSVSPLAAVLSLSSRLPIYLSALLLSSSLVAPLWCGGEEEADPRMSGSCRKRAMGRPCRHHSF